MVLSDKKILEHMKAGTVVIEPFIKENLSTSSVDLTLGEWYFKEQPPKNHRTIFNPYDKKSVDLVWDTKPNKAEYAKDAFENFNFNFKGINKKDRVILLSPGETVLAHTNEFVGGRDEVTTMMKARSSLGRVFIEVCKCAGWGDVGYVNRWTMEITNNSRVHTIPLVVGRRIAQLIFFETGEILKNDYAKKGKYQTTTDIKALKKNWDPKMMLPRLYKDREVTKKK
ncbi:MAG: dCTP deaminase [Parcubacteria group bacterium]|nr:dCTP deaminase [Parcubacteria group bacterium]